MLIQPEAPPLFGFGRLVSSLRNFCLWFSYPIAVWLTSGWIGLLLHWQAGLDPVRQWKGSRPHVTRWRRL